MGRSQNDSKTTTIQYSYYILTYYTRNVTYNTFPSSRPTSITFYDFLGKNKKRERNTHIHTLHNTSDTR